MVPSRLRDTHYVYGNSNTTQHHKLLTLSKGSLLNSSPQQHFKMLTWFLWQAPDFSMTTTSEHLLVLHPAKRLPVTRDTWEISRDLRHQGTTLSSSDRQQMALHHCAFNRHHTIRGSLGHPTIMPSAGAV